MQHWEKFKDFDLVCNTEIKTDEYYLSILAIHARLYPTLQLLSNLSYSGDSTEYAVALKEAYSEGGFMRTHLFQCLYDKRNYHQEFVRQLSDILKKNGIAAKVTNIKVRDPKNPLASAANFL